MQIKNALYKPKGMRRDDSYSSFNPEFSWENHNIRLTARDGNDLLSVTNERGNKQLIFVDSTAPDNRESTYTVIFNDYDVELIKLLDSYIVEFNEYIPELIENYEYNYTIDFNDYYKELVVA